MQISLKTAQDYLNAGLSVLPAKRQYKCPAIRSWKDFQERLPRENEVNAWFSNSHDAICIVTGKASGNLEILDFDNGGELFDAWSAIVEENSPGVLDRLVVENTPSGGWHVVYRCESEVDGNLKLAQGIRNEKLTTLIETRGHGGLFLCAPTQKYELVQGDFTQVLTITTTEREMLLNSARKLNEYWKEENTTVQKTQAASLLPVNKTAGNCSSGLLPGDDFNQRGDVKALLEKHGWKFLYHKNDNDFYRRPGKASGGHSATLKDNSFYVFSSNAHPFEPDQTYKPFAVYTMLEGCEDFSYAASQLAKLGYGTPLTQQNNSDVDTSGIVKQAEGIITPKKDIIVPHAPLSLRNLLEQNPTLRSPIIHGLLRQGETLNIIAPSKTGKSWLVIDLAISISTGLPWLGMRCEPGKVLILDNELHSETSANRIPKVASARGIGLGLINDRIFIENLRGRLMDILSMDKYFKQFKPEQFDVIILDAFYRFLPAGTDENDNGAMANIYNQIDHYADALKCSFVLIHHTSKGNQAMKSVTDVGAGAGTQARATDSHFVMRNHEEEDVVVIEAVVRSWPPLNPYCLHWNFPVWDPAYDLDPTRLLGMKQEHERRVKKDMEPGEFVTTFFHENPISKARIYELASLEGLTQQRTKALLQLAEDSGLLYRWRMQNGTAGFATEPQGEDDSAKMKIIAEILKTPGKSSAEIADDFDVSKRWVRKIRNQLER